jgi:hypothetical protein
VQVRQRVEVRELYFGKKRRTDCAGVVDQRRHSVAARDFRGRLARGVGIRKVDRDMPHRQVGRLHIERDHFVS